MEEAVIFFLLDSQNADVINTRKIELSNLLKKLDFEQHHIEISFQSFNKDTPSSFALKTSIYAPGAWSRVIFNVDSESEFAKRFPSAYKLKNKEMSKLY